MFGKFVIECDTEYFGDAVQAAKDMTKHTEKSVVATAQYGDGTEVWMLCRRLRRSISIRQIKP